MVIPAVQRKNAMFHDVMYAWSHRVKDILA